VITLLPSRTHAQGFPDNSGTSILTSHVPCCLEHREVPVSGDRQQERVAGGEGQLGDGEGVGGQAACWGPGADVPEPNIGERMGLGLRACVQGDGWMDGRMGGGAYYWEERDQDRTVGGLGEPQ
jgi:hypothetical protein